MKARTHSHSTLQTLTFIGATPHANRFGQTSGLGRSGFVTSAGRADVIFTIITNPEESGGTQPSRILFAQTEIFAFTRMAARTESWCGSATSWP